MNDDLRTERLKPDAMERERGSDLRDDALAYVTLDGREGVECERRVRICDFCGLPRACPCDRDDDFHELRGLYRGRHGGRTRD